MAEQESGMTSTNGLTSQCLSKHAFLFCCLVSSLKMALILRDFDELIHFSVADKSINGWDNELVKPKWKIKKKSSSFWIRTTDVRPIYYCSEKLLKQINITRVGGRTATYRSGRPYCHSPEWEAVLSLTSTCRSCVFSSSKVMAGGVKEPMTAFSSPSQSLNLLYSDS